MNKKDRIEKIMHSLDGMDRARPPVHAFLKIKERIDLHKAEQKTMRSKQWLAVAAVILLMICGNILAIATYYIENDNTAGLTESSELITDLNLYQP